MPVRLWVAGKYISLALKKIGFGSFIRAEGYSTLTAIPFKNNAHLVGSRKDVLIQGDSFYEELIPRSLLRGALIC